MNLKQLKSCIDQAMEKAPDGDVEVEEMGQFEFVPILIPEYPEGQHSIEMLLVEMLTEKQSWHTRQKIGNALYAVRKHAYKLRSEQKIIKGNGGGAKATE